LTDSTPTNQHGARPTACVDYGLEALSHLPEFAILGGGGECVAGDVGDVITNAQAAIEDASARLKLAKKELEDALAALTK
jgi:hypothetical protein